MGFVFREDPAFDDQLVNMAAAITSLRDDRKALMEYVMKLDKSKRENFDKRNRENWYNKKFGDPIKWYEQNKESLAAVKAREVG